MPPSDATPYIISCLSACVAFMAGVLSTVLLAKLGSLTKKLDELSRDLGTLQVTAEGFRGFATTAHAEITALKANTLTRELFVERTGSQDEKLDDLKSRVEKIDRGLGARPTRSEMSMPAVRPPLRRTDGPTDDAPSTPPPPRPRKPSGRFGGE
jgi:hypothetical protein